MINKTQANKEKIIYLTIILLLAVYAFFHWHKIYNTFNELYYLVLAHL